MFICQRAAVRSPASTLLGQLSHNGTLNGNDSYSAQLPVTLPNGISGVYYLLVDTNANADVIEGAGASNNLTASNSINITLAPFANLAIGDVTAPTQVIGSPVDLTVSWTVTNNGNGAGNQGSWDDRVILSHNSSPGLGGDIVLGDFPHTGGLALNASYTTTQVVTIPAGTQGRFNLFVETNATQTVYEGTTPLPNFASPNHPVDVTPTPYADLVVNSVIAQPTGQNNQPLTVSWQVTNQGIATTSTSEWTDNVSYSSDSTGATGRVDLGSFDHSGPLAVNGSYTRTAQVTLPANLPAGTIYIFVTTGASDDPYEFIYTDNNTTSSEAVQTSFVALPQPDLQPQAMVARLLPTTALQWT